MSNSSIDRILSGAITLGQSRPGSNDNKMIFHIPQNSGSGASPSDSFVSYQGLLLGGSYPRAEMQSMYSTAPANLANKNVIKKYQGWTFKRFI